MFAELKFTCNYLDLLLFISTGKGQAQKGAKYLIFNQFKTNLNQIAQALHSKPKHRMPEHGKYMILLPCWY